MPECKAAALITGATGDIGRALCETFTQAGYYVVASDRQEAAEVGDRYLALDLAALPRNAPLQSSLLETISEMLDHRPLAVCVNNAAAQILGSLEQVSDGDFQRTLDVNLFAPLVLTRMLAPRLERAEGCVVNIGSVHARATKPGFVSYATSKAALLGLTQALAVDLGPRVRVNIIQPAAVATAMLRAGFEDRPGSYTRLRDFHPTGRIAEAQEVAHVALFLASQDARSITGAAIDVHNGIGVRLHDPE